MYDQLVSVGAECGVRNAGMFALNSLRMEKGFRHWGHDLDTETSPLEARLGFTVDMKKVRLSLVQFEAYIDHLPLPLPFLG